VVQTQIWDTAAAERFRTIPSSYYRGANGIIIVYDVTSRESFNNVKKWMDLIWHFARSDVNLLLVGNISDLESEKVVSYDEGKELADRLGVKFLETSAKTSQNVREAFYTIASDIKFRLDLGAASPNKETLRRGERLKPGEGFTNPNSYCRC
jgi:Ras-related protein Rab-1A